MRDQLVSWLFDTAFPLWWYKGADRINGGFFERISLSGDIVEAPRRIRVVGRQMYSYSAAMEIGWKGPGREAVEHGISFLLDKGRAPDGTFFCEVRYDGNLIKKDFCLYDQAFAIFGLAAATRIMPDQKNLPLIAIEALAAMRRGWSHPLGGFREHGSYSGFLVSNPHMHLLEASLAWIDSGADTDLTPWHVLADEIAELCMLRFLHPRTKVILEYFDDDWSPISGGTGSIFEPGHQYEWAWLLHRWGCLRGRADALSLSRKLIQTAEKRGLDQQQFIWNEVLDNFSVRDARSRLWQHCERFKALLVLSKIENGSHTDIIDKIESTFANLNAYLQTIVPGLWYDIRLPNGEFLSEDARASSLYHIVNTVEELHRNIKYGQIDDY